MPKHALANTAEGEDMIRHSTTAVFALAVSLGLSALPAARYARPASD
jgi:hypothetical protein